MKWSPNKLVVEKTRKTLDESIKRQTVAWHGKESTLPFKLPIEVIYAILKCENLTAPDLMNLRLVSRALAELAASRLFSEIRLDFVDNYTVEVKPSDDPKTNIITNKTRKPRSRKTSLMNALIPSSLRTKSPSPPPPLPEPVFETVFPALNRVEKLLSDTSLQYVCRFNTKKLVILADKHMSNTTHFILKKAEEPKKTAFAFRKFCDEYAERLLDLLENLQTVSYHVSNDDYIRGSDENYTSVDPDDFQPSFGRFLLLLNPDRQQPQDDSNEARRTPSGGSSNIEITKRKLEVKATYTITLVAQKFRVEDLIPQSCASEHLTSLSIFFRSDAAPVRSYDLPARGYKDRIEKAKKRIALVIAGSPNLTHLTYMSGSTLGDKTEIRITLDDVLCSLPAWHELKLKKLKIPWEEINLSLDGIRMLENLEELHLERYYMNYASAPEQRSELDDAWRRFAEVGVRLRSIKAHFTGDEGMIDYLKMYGENYDNALTTHKPRRVLEHLQFDVMPYEVVSLQGNTIAFEDFSSTFRTDVPQVVFDNLLGLHLPSFRNRMASIVKMQPALQIHLEHWDVKKFTFSSISLRCFSGLLLMDDGRSFDKFLQTLRERPKLQRVNLIVIPTWWRNPKHGINTFKGIERAVRDSWSRMRKRGLMIKLSVFSEVEQRFKTIDLSV